MVLSGVPCVSYLLCDFIVVFVDVLWGLFACLIGRLCAVLACGSGRLHLYGMALLCVGFCEFGGLVSLFFCYFVFRRLLCVCYLFGLVIYLVCCVCVCWVLWT